MFRTWIIRQRNTVWVRRLADIVTSLARNYCVGERVIQCDIYISDLLNNIIIGINELYVCKYLLDLFIWTFGETISTWREDPVNSNGQDKYCYFSKSYITTCKQSLQRLCFHRCLSVHGGEDRPGPKHAPPGHASPWHQCSAGTHTPQAHTPQAHISPRYACPLGYLSSVNHEPSILMMRRDGQKRKIIRKMCI